MTTFLTQADIDAKIKNVSYHVIDGTTTTICNITLENGFSVQGCSACVDPNHFNSADGERYSYEDAVNKIWPLEGYLLKQRLYEQELAGTFIGELREEIGGEQ